MEDQTPIVKQIKFDLSRFKVEKNLRGSRRGEMIDKFLSRINPSREAGGYKPLTPAALNRMISHIPTDQLYPFYKDCERAKNFSKYFFWSIKANKE